MVYLQKRWILIYWGIQLITITDISKSIKKAVLLDEISFSLPKGKVLGILGPNGAGKTTLLKILAMVMKPDHGHYLINDEDALRNPKFFRQLIGYVPQDLALFDEISVLDNLIYWSNPQIRHNHKNYRQLLAKFELDDIRRKKVRTLSGGMKRRLNLAVAMINAPEILIMDEPLVGVDVLQLKHLKRYLRQLSAGGVTQVITSHNASALIDLVDQIMLIHQGVVRYYQYKAAFLSLCNHNLGSVDEQILKIIYE